MDCILFSVSRHDQRLTRFGLSVYQRPERLRALLRALQHQAPQQAFTYSIVVVDNDSLGSAEPVVQEARAYSAVAIRYDVEPQRNIALARNKAVAYAEGEFLAFIDDDETPIESWLENLYQHATTRRRTASSGRSCRAMNRELRSG